MSEKQLEGVTLKALKGMIEENLDQFPSDLLEKILTQYVDQTEAARMLGRTRQALHQMPEGKKRTLSGVRTPQGWIFRRKAVELASLGKQHPSSPTPMTLHLQY